MGKRKKTDPHPNPPLKMVIARSPEKKKGPSNQQYAILDQKGDKDAMRSKRRASNINPKKWTEESDDDGDDLQVLEVYKPPQAKVPRILKPSQRPGSRLPAGQSLIMECFEEDLSPAQKAAYRAAVRAFDDVVQKVDAMKKKHGDALKVEHSDVYIRAEEVTVIEGPKPPPGQRSESPDLIVLDEDQPRPEPRITRGLATKKPIASGPPPAPQAAPTPQQPGLILMGQAESGLHIMPSHLAPRAMGQSLVLRAGSNGQFHVINNMGMNTAPVIAPNGSLLPPLAPRMALANTRLNSPTFLPPTNKKEKAAKPTSKAAPEQVVDRRGGRKGRKTPHVPMPVSVTGPEEDDSVNWVPLDEYYYSKKEGDPAYREQKGEYRFKCWYCCKMLYNNLRIMMHVQGHIDSEKQQNLDLSDLTQCKHCYKQFDTPFEMQCHVEKIHQNQSNVLVCRICEKDHGTQAELKLHMRVHNTCEMPYICQLCNFRSSVYNDVVDHFKKRHDSSRYMLCLYCLKTFDTKFAKNAGWGMTQVYYQHLLKHQTKATNKKCSWCKLAFNNKSDLALHKSKDHLPNYRGILGGSSGSTVNANSEQVMIRVPGSQGQQGKGKVKSLNAPVMQKVVFQTNLRLTVPSKKVRCVECRNSMNSADHYKKYTECSMCRFATTCNEAFAEHMSNFHSRGTRNKRRKEKALPKPMFCLCGFSSSYGNQIANHLIFCSKRTCYAEKPEPRYFEYDDEQEEFNPFEPYCEEPESPEVEEPSPEKDIPSLFGALGLVKKAPQRNASRPCSKESSPCREVLSAEGVVEEVLEDVLDAVFPASAEAGNFVNTLLDRVEEEVEGHKFRSEGVLAKMRQEAKIKSMSSEADTNSKSASRDGLSTVSSDYDPDHDSKASVSSGASKSSLGNTSFGATSLGATSFAGAVSSPSEDITEMKEETSQESNIEAADEEMDQETIEELNPDPPSVNPEEVQREELDDNPTVDNESVSEQSKPEVELDSVAADEDNQMDTECSLETPCDEKTDETEQTLELPNVDNPVDTEADTDEPMLDDSAGTEPNMEDKSDPQTEDLIQPEASVDEAVMEEVQDMLEDSAGSESNVEDKNESLIEDPIQTEASLEEAVMEEVQDITEEQKSANEELSEVNNDETNIQNPSEEEETAAIDEHESQHTVIEQTDEASEDTAAATGESATENLVEESASSPVGESPVAVSAELEPVQTEQSTSEQTSEEQQMAPSVSDQSSTSMEPSNIAEEPPSTQEPSSDLAPPTTSDQPSHSESSSASAAPREANEGARDVASTAQSASPSQGTPQATSKPSVSPSSSSSRWSDNRSRDDRDHKHSGSHSKDHYSQNRHNDGYRNQGYDNRDRNRDHHHGNRNNQGSYGDNRHNDRYGGHGYNRYDDRHGYNQHKGRHDNRDGYHDRRDNRGGYRGRGRGGYYGNQGYY